MNDTLSDLIHIGIYAIVFCVALSAFMLLLRYGKATVDSLEKDNMQKSSIEMGFGPKDAMTGFGADGMDALGYKYADKPIDRNAVYADILSLTDRYDEDDLENGSPVIVQIDRTKVGLDEAVITTPAVKNASKDINGNQPLSFSLLDIRIREKLALEMLLNDLLREISADGDKYQRHYVYDEDHELTHVIYKQQ